MLNSGAMYASQTKHPCSPRGALRPGLLALLLRR